MSCLPCYLLAKPYESGRDSSHRFFIGTLGRSNMELNAASQVEAQMDRRLNARSYAKAEASHEARLRRYMIKRLALLGHGAILEIFWNALPVDG